MQTVKFKKSEILKKNEPCIEILILHCEHEGLQNFLFNGETFRLNCIESDGENYTVSYRVVTPCPNEFIKLR